MLFQTRGIFTRRPIRIEQCLRSGYNMNSFIKATLIYVSSLGFLICAIVTFFVIVARLISMARRKTETSQERNYKNLLVPVVWFSGFVVLYFVCVAIYSSIPLDMWGQGMIPCSERVPFFLVKLGQHQIETTHPGGRFGALSCTAFRRTGCRWKMSRREFSDMCLRITIRWKSTPAIRTVCLRRCTGECRWRRRWHNLEARADFWNRPPLRSGRFQKSQTPAKYFGCFKDCTFLDNSNSANCDDPIGHAKQRGYNIKWEFFSSKFESITSIKWQVMGSLAFSIQAGIWISAALSIIWKWWVFRPRLSSATWQIEQHRHRDRWAAR